jgi:hypothetical protein
MEMPKSKLIKLSELDSSNRKLLAAARQAGLSSDKIIFESLQAAYGRLLKRGRGQAASSGENHNRNHNPGVSKPAGKQSAPSPRARADGDLGAPVPRKAQS